MYTFFTTPFTILTKHALWVHFVGNLFVWAQQFALKLSDDGKKNTHNLCAINRLGIIGGSFQMALFIIKQESSACILQISEWIGGQVEGGQS